MSNLLSRISKPHPSQVLIFVFVLLFLMGYWLLVVPQFEQLAHQLALLSSAEAPSLKVQTDQTKSAQKTANAATVSQVKSLLPSESQIYELTVQLESLAKAQGVLLTNLSVSPEAAVGAATTSAAATAASGAAAQVATAAQKTTISINASGQYSLMKQFVSSLTQMQRYITIQSITMTGGSAPLGTGAVPPLPVAGVQTDQINLQIVALAYQQT